MKDGQTVHRNPVVFQRAKRTLAASIARSDTKNVFQRANQACPVHIARWNTIRAVKSPARPPFIAAFQRISNPLRP